MLRSLQPEGSQILIDLEQDPEVCSQFCIADLNPNTFRKPLNPVFQAPRPVLNGLYNDKKIGGNITSSKRFSGRSGSLSDLIPSLLVLYVAEALPGQES